MPRAVDQDQRRAEIVHGVWALIASHGIEAVTMRRVAAAAGVSVGRIQHYFDSRADLVRESARAMIAGAEGLQAGAAADDLAALRHAVEHVIPRTPAERVGTTIWLAYVAASVADDELGRILAGAKRGQEDEVTRLLRAVSLRHDETAARRHARRLIAEADGLATRVLIGDLTGEDARGAMEVQWRHVLGPTDPTDSVGDGPVLPSGGHR